MQKLSNSKFISTVTIFLVLLLVAKLISLALWWYLPSEGIELNARKSYQVAYQRVDFRNMLIKAKVTHSQEKRDTASTAYSIDSLVLKGLYGNDSLGYAIVATKSNQTETSIVEVGEMFEGYKLKSIKINYVVFSRASKEYRLDLAEIKTNLRTSVQRVREVNQENYDEDGEHLVTREDIKYYSRNPSKIWKDISISPVKERKKIVGFKVTRIKANSKMAQLGLKKGDIMIRANNIKLTSFNDAIKLYKKIDKIDTIAIVVLRNNEEREIIYEIN